jgi:hypothetical protein
MQFVRSLVGIGAGAIVVACGGGGEGEPPNVDAPPTPDAPKPPVDAPPVSPDAPPMMGTCSTSTTASVGTNHGHTANVPLADVMAGTEKTYNIQGGSGHPHTITVTAAMFTMLKAGTPVVVASSLDAGHTHNVTITCV